MIFEARHRGRACSVRGFALVMVLVLAGVSLVSLLGIMSWSSENRRLTERNNQYFATVAAAEAATEKVLAEIERDYQMYGGGMVGANMDYYRQLAPSTSEHSGWADYSFWDAQGGMGRTYVQGISSFTYTNLLSQYQGLRGLAGTYRIISNARAVDSMYEIPVGVKQDLQLATVPVFQFAIFYSVELEINPGPVMAITGRVHSNTNLYCRPNSSLSFNDHVTAVGRIFNYRHPNDPTSPGSGPITYRGEHDSGVSSLTLPIGTNNTPDAVYAVIDIPPTGESPNSDVGKQRYYNKADMVVLVSNTTVAVTSGSFNGFATSISWSQAGTFLKTNVSFFNKRENKTINATEIDVAKLVSWSGTNTVLRPLLGSRDVNSIYIADQRTQTSSTQAGVRLVNGQTLPSQGLTVATKNPLYINGHFNAATAHLGTTNTSLTKPASLVADAITVLSGSWNDANGSSGLSSRAASSTTVNAAFLAGIVPTAVYSGAKQYSGGVENFPRFLEDWSGDTLTYNGSMVVMFHSRTATGLWKGTGSSIGIYNPPNRNWTFDLNFMDLTKLPPGTPELRAVIRAEWSTVRPNTVL